MQPELRRSVTLPWLVLYGLGTTVGAGIYALTGVVAGRVGMHAPVAFLGAALLAGFTALSFAELVSRYPRAAGEAVYVREAIGWHWLVIVVGLLVTASGAISAATVSSAFVGYLGAFVSLPGVVAVVGVVGALGIVAAIGVRESVAVAGVMTLVEVGGLLAIIAAGADALAEFPARIGEMIPRDLPAWHAVSLATVICFYAFLGFEDMVNVAEEVRDVRRTLPIGILLTLGLTALLYAGVTSVAVLVVDPERLGESAAPLADVFAASGGSAAALGVIAMIALLNGALIQVVKASRVLYGMAREGALPRVLGSVNARTRTPLLATAIVSGGVALLAVQFSLVGLAEATASLTLATFALANLSLILVQRRGPAPAGVLTTPGWVPACGLVVSTGFLALELLSRLR